MRKIQRLWHCPCILRAGVVLSVAVAMSAAHAARPDIGVASLVVKQVEGTVDQRTRQLTLRDKVFLDEVVQTGIQSASELHLADDTRITVGPNSKVVLDKFVYDPEPGKGALLFQATEGVFRFFSGNMASSNYTIEASSVTVGIRGTIFVGAVRPSDGAFALILESQNSNLFITTKTGNTVVLDAPGQAAIALPDGSVAKGPAPAWAIAMVKTMDGTVVAGRTQRQPPQPADPQDRAAPAPASPPASPPVSPPAAPEPDPEDDEDGGKLRGLLRALSNQDPDDVPSGLESALEKDSTARARGGSPPGHGDDDGDGENGGRGNGRGHGDDHGNNGRDGNGGGHGDDHGNNGRDGNGGGKGGGRR